MIRRVDEKVEGAAAGFYVAALFESGRPDHRGLDTARLARDAREAPRSLAARGRLRLARHGVRAVSRASRRPVYLAHVERGTGRPPRPRGGAGGSGSRVAVLSKPRRLAAA